MRNHRRAGRGLGEHGHSREKRRGGFLRQSPRRKIECVDLHRDAVARHVDVLAVKARRASELHALAVDQEFLSAERSAQFGVGLEREDRAVDVELRVRASVAAVRHREVEQLVPLRLDRLCHLLEKNPALGEAQRAQRRPAFAASVLERRGEIEALARDLRKRLLGSGIHERLRCARSLDPLVAEVTSRSFHAGAPFEWARIAQ